MQVFQWYLQVIKQRLKNVFTCRSNTWIDSKRQNNFQKLQWKIDSTSTYMSQWLDYCLVWTLLYLEAQYSTRNYYCSEFTHFVIMINLWYASKIQYRVFNLSKMSTKELFFLFQMMISNVKFYKIPISQLKKNCRTKMRSQVKWFLELYVINGR